MNLIEVRNASEEELMLKVVKEFANRVILPRKWTATETFKKFKDKGIYGVIGIDADENSGDTVYEIALPKHYIRFIEFLIEKERAEAP